MSEINGYVLTKEEEKECVALIRELRKRRVFEVSFSGCISIKAATHEQANNIFWKWVKDLQNESLDKWPELFAEIPYFENEGVEEV